MVSRYTLQISFGHIVNVLAGAPEGTHNIVGVRYTVKATAH
jgi:hypothetical protein